MTRVLLILLFAASMRAQGITGLSESAARNYDAVASGRVPIGSLSRREQAEVVELDRQLRKRRPTLSPSAERCRTRERQKAGAPTSALDERIIALRCD